MRISMKSIAVQPQSDATFSSRQKRHDNCTRSRIEDAEVSDARRFLFQQVDRGVNRDVGRKREKAGANQSMRCAIAINRAFGQPPSKAAARGYFANRISP